jgi:hypothetical protein
MIVIVFEVIYLAGPGADWDDPIRSNEILSVDTGVVAHS